MATEEFKKIINNLWEDYVELTKKMQEYKYDTNKYSWLDYKKDYLEFISESDINRASDELWDSEEEKEEE